MHDSQTDRIEDGMPEEFDILQRVREAEEALTRLNSSESAMDPLVPLLTLCQGFLAMIGAGLSSEFRTDNPVLFELSACPADACSSIMGQAASYYSYMRQERRAEHSVLKWFESSLGPLSQCVKCSGEAELPDSLKIVRAGTREAKILHRLAGQEGNIRRHYTYGAIRPWGLGDTPEPPEIRVHTSACKAIMALCDDVRQLRQRNERPTSSESSSNEPWKKWYESVRHAYWGLELLLMVHFDFSRHELMKQRSVLNHSGLDNTLSILFVSDRLASTAAVLAGTAQLEEFPATREALHKWPLIREELLQNAEQLENNFDPLSRARHSLQESLPYEVCEWLFMLNRECVLATLGIRYWKESVVNAMHTFDAGLEEARRKLHTSHASGPRNEHETLCREVIDNLRRLHRSLVEAHSGSHYFNFG